MILVWFIIKELLYLARIARARWRMRKCAQEQQGVLQRLGRTGWELRKQHEGMDDILEELGKLEEEEERLTRQAEELEDEIRSTPGPVRDLQNRLDKALGRRAQVQQNMQRLYLTLGKALDSTRHHDAALVEYYNQIDSCSERRDALRRHERNVWRSAVRWAPLALVELAILTALGVWAGRKAAPIFTQYHLVFRFEPKRGETPWGLSRRSGGSLRVKDGRLAIAAGPDVGLRVWPKKVKPFRNVLIKVRFVYAPGADAGVMFRYRDYDFYVVEFQPGRGCRLLLYLAGRRSVVAEWAAGGTRDDKSKSCDIEVKAVDDKVAASVDGRVAFVQDGLYVWPGRVGLFAPPGASAQIERYEVYVKGWQGWLNRVKPRP